MNGFKRSFLTASESVNFIIRFLEDGRSFVPFEEENNLTGEQLAFRRFDEDNGCWLVEANEGPSEPNE
uniref:DUF2958 domain-containing protein n=1 Tax=Globodera pallida TaxID=36090 RepID=A0A183CAN9_GLOPA